MTPAELVTLEKAAGSYLEQTGGDMTSSEIWVSSTGDRPLAVVKATDILHSLTLLQGRWKSVTAGGGGREVGLYIDVIVNGGIHAFCLNLNGQGNF